jgi:hypothetical protein
MSTNPEVRNAALLNKALLDARNPGVKSGNPETTYPHAWNFTEIQQWREASGDDFYLIIHGSPSEADDFFVIPFRAVKHVLTEDTLVRPAPPDTRRRWWFNIRKDQSGSSNTTEYSCKVSHTQDVVNVTKYYGNHHLLERAKGSSGGEGFLQVVEGDAPDARYLRPEEGDTPDEGIDNEPLVWRQIRVRRGQQDFRIALIDRYKGACQISGCRLLDVLEAAHIKEVKDGGDYDADNGLLLRADLHTLFDLDIIGINPEKLTVVVIDPEAVGAGYGDFHGQPLNCPREPPSQEFLEFRWRRFVRTCVKRLSERRGQ